MKGTRLWDERYPSMGKEGTRLWEKVPIYGKGTRLWEGTRLWDRVTHCNVGGLFIVRASLGHIAEMGGTRLWDERYPQYIDFRVP
jgi:hypothetical protein